MTWTRRLANLLRSSRHSRDLDRELAFHLAERTDALVAAGWSRESAEREARRRFGNYGAQKERTRDVDVFTWLDTFADDVRYALRTLRRSPGFAAVAVLSLGLGIGANTAIFTLIDAVVLRSLPVSHPEELVQVKMGDRGGYFTNPIWEQLRDRQDVFAGLFAFSTERFSLSETGETHDIVGNLVSGDFFHTLGVAPAAGRLLSIADDKRGCAPIAVISYAFWQTHFAGDPAVVDKTLRLDAKPFRIVGVAPSGFTGVEVGTASQVFAPLCAELVLHGAKNSLDRRSTWWLAIVGRPKPTVSRQRVSAGLAAIAPGIFESTTPQNWRAGEQREYRRTTLAIAPAATGLSELRHRYERALMILMGIVALVLLIACANVANLLLARAATRQREMAIRVAIGAARGRIVRQVLTESVMLSLVGALIGVLFARWGSRLLVSLLSSAGNTIFLDLALDGRVLAFSVAVAVLTALAFGMVPAWRSARVAPGAALKANERAIVGGTRRVTTSKSLVVAQVAVSLTLVVGAGLLLGTFGRLAGVDAGFRPENVLLVHIGEIGSHRTSAEQLALDQAIVSRLRATPGIAAASASMITPLGHRSWNDELVVDGFSPRSVEDDLADFNQVSDGYFEALGTPMLAGRDFGPEDRAGSPAVAIVTEAVARHFYRGRDVVGQTFRLHVDKLLSAPYRIVGVVKDAKYESLREESPPTVFVPVSQDSALTAGMDLEIRADGNPVSIIPRVKGVLTELNPRTTMTFVPLAEQVAATLRSERLLATLSAFFGALALTLATMGLYGVMSYSVARRRNEIGIRMALGAGRRRVTRMVLADVAVVLFLGLGLGLALALGVTRVIASFLFGLTPTNLPTFVGSMSLLALAGLAAAYVPARRAARIDPMDALREE